MDLQIKRALGIILQTTPYLAYRAAVYGAVAAATAAFLIPLGLLAFPASWGFRQIPAVCRRLRDRGISEVDLLRPPGVRLHHARLSEGGGRPNPGSDVGGPPRPGKRPVPGADGQGRGGQEKETAGDAPQEAAL